MCVFWASMDSPFKFGDEKALVVELS